MQTPFDKAIQFSGNATRLAETMGVTTQAVCNWRDRKRELSAENCIAIEAATGGLVRCEDLRPDVAWHVLRQKPDLASAERACEANESVVGQGA